MSLQQDWDCPLSKNMWKRCTGKFGVKAQEEKAVPSGWNSQKQKKQYEFKISSRASQ